MYCASSTLRSFSLLSARFDVVLLELVIKKKKSVFVLLIYIYPLCLFIKFSWSVLKFVLFYVFNYFNYYFVLKVITQNKISYLKAVNTLRLRVITLNIFNKRNQ